MRAMWAQRRAAVVYVAPIWRWTSAFEGPCCSYVASCSRYFFLRRSPAAKWQILMAILGPHPGFQTQQNHDLGPLCSNAFRGVGKQHGLGGCRRQFFWPQRAWASVSMIASRTYTRLGPQTLAFGAEKQQRRGVAFRNLMAWRVPGDRPFFDISVSELQCQSSRPPIARTLCGRSMHGCRGAVAAPLGGTAN